MPKQNQIQHFFIIGVLVVAMTIISAIFVMLIFLAPSVLLHLAGLPMWPILLISIPVSFVILGWVIITIGRFRRK